MLQKVMSQFPRKFFLTHNTKTFRRGTLLCCVSEKLRSRKSLWIRRGEYHHFLSNIFCLTVPEKFVGEPFSKSPVSGIEKIYASDGYVTIFYQKVFCLTVPERFVEEPFFAVFQKNSSSEKVYE